MKELTVDIFIDRTSKENLSTTLKSIVKFKTSELYTIIKPVFHVLSKLEDITEIVNLRHEVNEVDASIDVIGYLEPDHKSLEKKCHSLYVAFIIDGCEFDTDFFANLYDTLYKEKKPILLARNNNVSCTTRFMYSQFCLSPNPLQEIYNSCIYKHSNLILDLGDKIVA